MSEPDENSPTGGPTAPDPGLPGTATGSDVSPPAVESLSPGRSTTTTPFRRHPVRWTVAAGGLAAMLALGGYGVTQAATNSTSGTTSAQGRGGAMGSPPGGSSRAPGGGASAEGMPTGGPGGTPPTGPAGRGGTVGRVTALSGDTITLSTFNNKTVTVTVTAATVYKEGTKTSSLSALKKGDVAQVAGSTSSDGTVTASTITFGTAPSGAPGLSGRPTGS